MDCLLQVLPQIPGAPLNNVTPRKLVTGQQGVNTVTISRREQGGEDRDPVWGNDLFITPISMGFDQLRASAGG
jgi:hypothetical protein